MLSAAGLGPGCCSGDLRGPSLEPEPPGLCPGALVLPTLLPARTEAWTLHHCSLVLPASWSHFPGGRAHGTHGSLSCCVERPQAVCANRPPPRAPAERPPPCRGVRATPGAQGPAAAQGGGRCGAGNRVGSWTLPAAFLPAPPKPGVACYWCGPWHAVLCRAAALPVLSLLLLCGQWAASCRGPLRSAW